MRRQRSLFFLGILLTTTFHSQSSFAQGIITQDPQGFAQKAAQFGEQIANMASQLEQAKAMLTSMTGNGNFLSNLAPGMLDQLKDVLPSNWQNVYDDAMGAGSSLASSANQINSTFSNKLGSMDKLQALQYVMMQSRNQGGYDRAMAQQAYNGINQTWENLRKISGEIDSVGTEKESLDLQNRLQAASGQVQTQVAQVQLMQMLQNAQTKLLEAQKEQAATQYALGEDDEVVPAFNPGGGAE
ncbi:hypothetical protein AD949_01155 [Acetobacter orleanensis]|nr:hypothetical protein AD949_01155 [Acetobacter orleanensis]PCD78359.1 hypothetical protein CO710_12710 [Acetobacter orleanensis]